MVFAEIIQILHLALIVGIIVSVFINNCFVKQLALTFLIYLLVQYMFGLEKCGLTELEYWIVGEENHKQGFMYRLINPIIKIPEDYFNSGLLYTHVIWIIILVYQIYRSKCSFALLG